jgi:hypothetical protein
MMETPSPRQGQEVGQCLAAGVVEVHGDAPERNPVTSRFDHAAGGERRPCPDGVAERDLLAAQLVQSPGEGRHRSGRQALRKDRPTQKRQARTGRPAARSRPRATAGSGSDDRQQHGVPARQGGEVAVRYDPGAGGEVTYTICEI